MAKRFKDGSLLVTVVNGTTRTGLYAKDGSTNVIDAPISPSGSTFPDATNTGPTPGTSFVNTSGEVNTTTDGQVIQNLNLTGQINVHHNNVTIQDCIINCSDAFFGINTFSEIRTGLKVLRCRIFGGKETNSCIAPDGQSNAEIAFCDLSGKENGIFIGGNNYNIHDNYLHDLGGEPPDPHVDGIQGAGGISGITINHNTIISLDTSCIIMQTEGGSFSGVTISNNLFKGDPSLPPPQLAHGILCQALDSTPGNTCTNVSITNNRFQVPSMTFPCFLHKVNGYTFTGNVNDATNLPITFNDGGGNTPTVTGFDVEALAVGGPVGTYNKCGALHVLRASTPVSKARAPNGALWVSTTPYTNRGTKITIASGTLP